MPSDVDEQNRGVFLSKPLFSEKMAVDKGTRSRILLLAKMDEIRRIGRIQAIELLQRTAHYFQGNVTSGDYMVRIDTESPNPSLYIKVIIYPEEVVTEDEKAKQVKKLIDPDPFVGLI